FAVNGGKANILDLHGRRVTPRPRASQRVSRELLPRLHAGAHAVIEGVLELFGAWSRESLVAQIDVRGELRGWRVYNRIKHQGAVERMSIALGFWLDIAVVVEFNALSHF